MYILSTAYILNNSVCSLKQPCSIGHYSDIDTLSFFQEQEKVQNKCQNNAYSKEIFLFLIRYFHNNSRNKEYLHYITIVTNSWNHWDKGAETINNRCQNIQMKIEFHFMVSRNRFFIINQGKKKGSEGSCNIGIRNLTSIIYRFLIKRIESENKNTKHFRQK